MEKKLTYNNVIAEIRVIHMSPGGVEYIANDYYNETNEKPDFHTKSADVSYMKECGYSKEDIKYYRNMYKEANKNLNLWKKGLRRVIRMAKNGPSAIDQMAGAYTGNGLVKNQWEYFWKLYRELGNELIEMGANPNTHPVITNYVDGSSTHEMKRY